MRLVRLLPLFLVLLIVSCFSVRAESSVSEPQANPRQPQQDIGVDEAAAPGATDSLFRENWS
ncbi:MAG: hypothetical protein A2Y61_02865 [Chloroflexi bacterium RBG_13_60_13]|nr:MAG: hypothetical protein A2Y61_02865 [Chloroflexi bacterium RBG_13_60_13]